MKKHSGVTSSIWLSEQTLLHWMATQSEQQRASAKAFAAWLILQGIGDERSFYTKFLSLEDFEKSAKTFVLVKQLGGAKCQDLLSTAQHLINLGQQKVRPNIPVHFWQGMEAKCLYALEKRIRQTFKGPQDAVWLPSEKLVSDAAFGSETQLTLAQKLVVYLGEANSLDSAVTLTSPFAFVLQGIKKADFVNHHIPMILYAHCHNELEKSNLTALQFLVRQQETFTMQARQRSAEYGKRQSEDAASNISFPGSTESPAGTALTKNQKKRLRKMNNQNNNNWGQDQQQQSGGVGQQSSSSWHNPSYSSNQQYNNQQNFNNQQQDKGKGKSEQGKGKGAGKGKSTGKSAAVSSDTSNVRKTTWEWVADKECYKSWDAKNSKWYYDYDWKQTASLKGSNV